MSPSRLPVLFHAPHRAFFAAGALQAVLALVWWGFELAARHAGLPALPAWPLPASWLHAALLGFGVFPFFVFGFAMTAGPRWQAAAPLRPAAWIVPFLLMAAGGLGFYLALGWPQLMAPALVLVLLGWCAGLAALWPLARAPGGGRSHILAVLAGLTLGALLLAAFAAHAAGAPPWLGLLAVRGLTWFFLLPVFVAVCHRMVPFFSAAVLPQYRPVQPAAGLYLLLAAAAVHGVLTVAGQPQWTWLVDLPAALVALWLSWAWQLRRAFAVRLLAMLHVAFLWLGAALALAAADSLLQQAGRGGLGLAPLHALTLGFFASALIGMVTRVSLGHSGRPLRAGGGVWLAFWGMQAVALLRLAGEFLSLPGAGNPNLLAAAGWLLVFGGWSVKFMPLYFRPRADGQPG